jgi:hypothetical protein
LGWWGRIWSHNRQEFMQCTLIAFRLSGGQYVAQTLMKMAYSTQTEIICVAGSKGKSSYLGISLEERMARSGGLQAVQQQLRKHRPSSDTLFLREVYVASFIVSL